MQELIDQKLKIEGGFWNLERKNPFKKNLERKMKNTSAGNVTQND